MRFSKSAVLLSLFSVGASVVVPADSVQACHGRSRGYSGGGGHYSSHAPAYRVAPNYPPVSMHPGFPEPEVVFVPRSARVQQNVLVQPQRRPQQLTRVAQVRQAEGGLFQQTSVTTPVSQNSQVQAGPGNGPVPGNAPVAQSAPGAVSAATGQNNNFRANTVNTGAPPVNSGNTAAPVDSAAVGSGNSAQNADPSTSNATTTAHAVTQGSDPTADAERSALEALGGFAAPAETTPSEVTASAEAPSQPAHIGQWRAALPNGSNVQLTLQADGNFVWVATSKDGSNSSFEGTYSVGQSSLILVRSSDNQKLTGAMTLTGSDGFSFQLNSKKAAALNFVRS
ncbi:MAG: hypothetical protein ACK50J_10985 [Planctomyces sp.]